MNTPFTNREKLYLAAVAELGKDASPKDIAEDELACAESVQNIHYKTFGRFICPQTLSTYAMYQAFLMDGIWEQTFTPEPGTIVIAPSGYSSKGAKNGHVGIVSLGNMIMSNSSGTGMWLENYSIDSWKLYYGQKLGFPVLFFNKI